MLTVLAVVAVWFTIAVVVALALGMMFKRFNGDDDTP